ncbi:hypothetical protein DMENIID0001_058830 [Sergentomyia squamirostris]
MKTIHFLFAFIVWKLVFLKGSYCFIYDEYSLGKPVATDDILHEADYDFTDDADGCVKLPVYPKSCNNETHFTLHFSSSDSGTCITGIHLKSGRFFSNQGRQTKSFIFCEQGGIDTNNCLFVFEKRERRRDGHLTIYGIHNRPYCSLRERIMCPQA